MEKTKRIIDLEVLNTLLNVTPNLAGILLQMVEAYLFKMEDLDETIKNTLEHYKILR